MGLKLEQYLEKSFTDQVSKILNVEIPDQQTIDTLFSQVYPLVALIPRCMNIYDDDIIGDLVFHIYENFGKIIGYASNLYKKNPNFVFIYYIVKICKQRLINILKLHKQRNHFSEVEFYDFYSEKIQLSQYNSKEREMDLLKQCIKLHLNDDERALFLLYYYEIIEHDDFVFLCTFFKLTPVEVLDLLSLFRGKNDTVYEKIMDLHEKFSRFRINENIEKTKKIFEGIMPTGDLETISPLFKAEAKTLRTRIFRIREKMKKKCN